MEIKCDYVRQAEAASDLTGRGRWDWDIRSCMYLFAALKVDLTDKLIKPCRQVGKAAGPLLVRFYKEKKGQPLRSDTRGSMFEDVEV